MYMQHQSASTFVGRERERERDRERQRQRQTERQRVKWSEMRRETARQHE